MLSCEPYLDCFLPSIVVLNVSAQVSVYPKRTIMGNFDVFQSGFTPLHIASHYGNIHVGRLLIEKSGDVNFKARV